MLRRLLLITLPLWTLIPAGAQTEWYVDETGQPNGSGSVADPFPSIHAALASPQVNGGDRILVAPGTYVGGFLLEQLELVSLEGPRETIIEMHGGVGGIGLYQSLVQGFTLRDAGAIEAIFFAHGTLRQCIVDGFLGGSTGAIYLGGSPVFIADRCTFVNNGVVIQQPFFGTSTVHVRNSIFWGNSLDLGANGTEDIYVSYSRFTSILGTLTLDFQNVSADPLFWDAASGDFQLRPSSPCIGTGWFAGSPVDMGALPFDPSYAPEPTTYCSTAPNSVGDGARIGSSGSWSVAANEFSLHVTEATPNQWGKFYYGAAPVEQPFGDGFRCVGGGSIGTFRLYPSQLSDASGSATRALDFSVSPTGGGGPGSILPGSTWFFQFWYRDPFGPGGTGFNLSDGLRASFAP